MRNGYPADVVFPFAYLSCLWLCRYFWGPLKFRMGRFYRWRFLGLFFPRLFCSDCLSGRFASVYVLELYDCQL